MSNKDADLLKDPIKQLIFKLSIPVMAAGLLRTSYNFTDLIFASRLGGIQVASVAFVGPLFMLVSALGIGLSTGGVSIIARFIGEKRINEASNHAVQLRFITLVIALFISLLGFFVIDLILPLLGLTDELFEQSSIYTKIRFLSIPFILIYQLYMSFYKSQGKMNITLKMALIGLIGNTILNTIFIFILKMGIDGLAYATLITQMIQALIIFISYHRSTHDFNLSINIIKNRVDLKVWKKILKICLPLSFSHSSTSFGFLLINTFIVGYGYEVVAAFAIGNQIHSLFFSPSAGIGQSLVPLVAQNSGQNAARRIKEIIRTGFISSLIFGIVGAIIIQIIAKPLGLFLSKGDDLILFNVMNYVRLVGWSLIGWVIFQCFSGVFNGLQKTNITMMINVVRLWGVRIPMLLIFRYLFVNVKAWGVWITMFTSNMITAVFAIIFYFLIVPKILEQLEKK